MQQHCWSSLYPHTSERRFVVPKADGPHAKKGSEVDAKALTNEVLRKLMVGAIPPQPPPNRSETPKEPPPVRHRPGLRTPEESTKVPYSKDPRITYVTSLPNNRQTRVKFSTNSAGESSMAEEKKGVWQRLPPPIQIALVGAVLILFLQFNNRLSLAKDKEELPLLQQQMELAERQVKIDRARAGLSSGSQADVRLQTASTFSCETLKKLNDGFEQAVPQMFTSGFHVPHGCAVVEIGFRVGRVEGTGYEIRLPDVDPSPGMLRSFFPDCNNPAKCAADLNMSAGKKDRRVLIITRNGGNVTIQP